MSSDRSHAAQRQISEVSEDAAPYIDDEEQGRRSSGLTVSGDVAARDGQRIMHQSHSDSRLRTHNETVQPSSMSHASSQLVVSSRRRDDHYSDVSKSEPSAESMQTLIQEYSHLMPSEIKVGYYDVMILYSKDDQEAAEMYRDHLQNDIELEKGHRVKAVLYDDEELRSLSESMLRGLDEGFKRCTFAFVYLTKSFCDCEWCSLSSEGCLMETIYNKDKKWCVVPVYTVQRSKADFKIPMGLNSLKGVNYYNNDDFYRRGLKRLIGDRLHIRLKKEEKLILEQYKWACEERNRELVQQQLYKTQQEDESRKHQAFQKYFEQKEQAERQQVAQHHRYLPSGYQEYSSDSMNSQKKGQYVSGSKSMVTKLPSENTNIQVNKQGMKLLQQNSYPRQSKLSQPTESSSFPDNPQVGLSSRRNPVESIDDYGKDESLPHPEKQALKQAIHNFKSLNVFPAQEYNRNRLTTSREPSESLEEIIPPKEDKGLHETDGGISQNSGGSDHHLTVGLEDRSLQRDGLQSQSLEHDYASRHTTPGVNLSQNQTRQPSNPESDYTKAFHDESQKPKVIVHEHHHFYETPSQRPIVKNYNIVGAHSVIVGEGGTIISGSSKGNSDVEEEDEDEEEGVGASSPVNSGSLQKSECPPTRTEHSSSMASSVREDGGSRLDTCASESNIPGKQNSAAAELTSSKNGQKQVILPTGTRDSKQKLPLISDQRHKRPTAVATVMPMSTSSDTTVRQKSQGQYSSDSNMTNQKTAVCLPQRTTPKYNTCPQSSSSLTFEKRTVVTGTSSSTDSEETFVKFPSHSLAPDNEVEETKLKTIISSGSGTSETDSSLKSPNKDTVFEEKKRISSGSLEIDGDCSSEPYLVVKKNSEQGICVSAEEHLAIGTDVDTGSDLTASDRQVQAVQMALEMGFTSVKVKQALNILRSKRKGHTHFSVPQLLDILEGSDFEVLEPNISDSVSDESAGHHQGAAKTHRSKNSSDMSHRDKKNCCIS